MEGLARQGLHIALSAWAIALVFVAYWIAEFYLVFLPPMGQIAGELPAFFTSAETYDALLITAQRVIISLVVTLVLGFGVAQLILAGGLAGRVASVYMNALLTIPSTIAALVALFVFRRDPIAVYVVVILVILPFVTMTLLQGMRSIDPKLNTMATVYKFRPRQRIFHVVLPQMVPFALAAIRNENAHAWRVVVLAELFAVNSGMGWQFTRAWDQFLLNEVMLWLLAFMTILLASEYLILVPLERAAQRWRRKT